MLFGIIGHQQHYNIRNNCTTLHYHQQKEKNKNLKNQKVETYQFKFEYCATYQVFKADNNSNQI